MRKLLAWGPCHGFYWVGHLASLVINRWPDCEDGSLMDRIGTVVYNIYQRSLLLSCDLNDWGGLNVWSKGNPNTSRSET